MFFRHIIISLFVLSSATIGLFAQEQALGQIYTLNQQEFIKCSKEKLYGLYGFLDASKPIEKKDFLPSYCGSVKKAIKMPAWLDKDLESMDKNRLWELPLASGETEYLSEAEMWRRPLLALSQLLSVAQKIDEGATFATRGIMEEFGLARIRLILEVERLKTNPRLIGYDMRDSMQGRGREVIATLELALDEADSMAEAFVSSHWKTKFRKASIALAILSNTI